MAFLKRRWGWLDNKRVQGLYAYRRCLFRPCKTGPRLATYNKLLSLILSLYAGNLEVFCLVLRGEFFGGIMWLMDMTEAQKEVWSNWSSNCQQETRSRRKFRGCICYRFFLYHHHKTVLKYFPEWDNLFSEGRSDISPTFMWFFLSTLSLFFHPFFLIVLLLKFFFSYISFHESPLFLEKFVAFILQKK